MLFRIDAAADVPLFAQLAASVRADAAAGRIRPGDRLPAAREVAGALRLNIHTVLHAYQLLRDEGLIELRRGRGAVVTAQAEIAAALRREIDDIAHRATRAGLTPDALASLIREAAQAAQAAQEAPSATSSLQNPPTVPAPIERTTP